MSMDPHPSNPAGAWVTAVPTHGRSGDLPAEVDIQRPAFVVPRGAQYGLAALLMAGPLMVAAPVQMLLSRTLWVQGPLGMNLPLLFAGTLLAVVVILGMLASGVFFGIRGCMLAVSERQPIALGLAGAMLSAAVLVLWAGIFIDLMLFFIRHMH
jgi:hypothetical protein